MPKIIREDLIYPELSFQIIGILFDVYNTIGYGFLEKVYQKAVAQALQISGLRYKEQLYAPIVYQDKRVGVNYFDFLIDDKVVLEIKKGDRFAKTHIDQLFQYLVNKKLKLGLLAYFSPPQTTF